MKIKLISKDEKKIIESEIVSSTRIIDGTLIFYTSHHITVICRCGVKRKKESLITYFFILEVLKKTFKEKLLWN